jgi:hypothetical protein
LQHQKTAAKLTGAEEARTLVYNNPGFGVFSTLSQVGQTLSWTVTASSSTLLQKRVKKG